MRKLIWNILYKLILIPCQVLDSPSLSSGSSGPDPGERLGDNNSTTFVPIVNMIMPPTSKKLTGHIDFGLCVHVFVRNVHAICYEPCILGF